MLIEPDWATGWPVDGFLLCADETDEDDDDDDDDDDEDDDKDDDDVGLLLSDFFCFKQILLKPLGYKLKSVRKCVFPTWLPIDVNDDIGFDVFSELLFWWRSSASILKFVFKILRLLVEI